MNEDSLRLYKAKEEEKEHEKLWQELLIDFRLEAFGFPDNKIYGTVNIIPEVSRQLIKTLVLVVNKTDRIEFNPRFTQLSASGFNVNQKNPSAYVEAIPYNDQWMKRKKVSKICYFFFTGESFVLTPMISFEWNNQNVNLRIRWYHIGDKYVQKYVLILDDAEVQYIRQKMIADAFDVQIGDFQPGEKHTFQLAARLNNGKETYRSDLIEFTVPDRQHINSDTTQFITVSNDPIPPDLPVIGPTEDDVTEEEFDPDDGKFQPPNVSKFNQSPEPPQPKPRRKIHTCCNQIPHKTFPGIEHYFRDYTNLTRFSSSVKSPSDDNDDDVITSKS